MTDDMLQWAEEPASLGVGKGSGGELLSGAQPPPDLPDLRLKPPRHRPNNGRQRRFIGPLLTEPPWELLEATGYPIPRDLTCLPAVPSQWRRGRPYRAWKLATYEMWGRDCHICMHGGADSIDHLVPLSMWGNQPYDPRISRPAHNVNGCPTCKVKCNSSRGNKMLARQIAQWQGAVRL